MKHTKTTTIIFLFSLIAHSYCSFGQFNHSRVYSTFDNLKLSKQDTFDNGATLHGGFFHFGRSWINDYNQTYKSWTGWSLSNMTDTLTSGYGNQFSAITGHGVSHTKNYLVANGNTFIKFDKPTNLSGAYFTNSTYTALDMQQGSGFSKKFGGDSGDDPDYFKVKFYAYLANSLADSSELFLADFRDADHTKDYIVRDWVYHDFNNDVDEDILVDSIAIVFESSDVGAFGMNTPAYFCMDDFNAISSSEIMARPIVFDTDTFDNGRDGAGGFSMAHLFLPNAYNTTYKSWSGWSISSKYDTLTAGYTNQYSSVKRPIVSNPPTDWSLETVHFISNGRHNSIRTPNFKEENEDIFGPKNSSSPLKFYITNTTYAALDMQDGSGFSKKFGGDSGDDPDYFRLLVKSVSSSNTILKTDTIYLADFRFEDNANDYILRDWVAADVVSCDRLDFELQSSDVGSFGMNTPAYFCMSIGQKNTNGVAAISSNNLVLFPNPVISHLTLKSNDLIKSVEIFTASGTRVSEKNNYLPTSDILLDVSNLNSGFYFARVLTDKGMSIYKFFKQ